MLIREVIWLDEILAKIEHKHRVSADEVEEVLYKRPKLRRIERGHVKGEDVYVALGRTEAGRYVSVFFVRKRENRALVISARDMDAKERRLYGHK